MIPNMYYIIKTMNHLQFGCFIVSFIALILIMCFVDLMKFICAFLKKEERRIPLRSCKFLMN